MECSGHFYPEEFFVEFGKVVSSATEGKWREAGETALVTVFITVLGGVTNLGANSATMAQVNDWHLSGREMDGVGFMATLKRTGIPVVMPPRIPPL